MLRPVGARYSSPMDILEQEAERDPQAETLRRISLLLSGSSFVPLEPRKTGEEPVDRAEALTAWWGS